MKKLIPVSMFLLASPIAWALLVGKRGPHAHNIRIDKVPKESEVLFIGS